VRFTYAAHEVVFTVAPNLLLADRSELWMPEILTYTWLGVKLTVAGRFSDVLEVAFKGSTISEREVILSVSGSVVRRLMEKVPPELTGFIIGMNPMTPPCV